MTNVSNGIEFLSLNTSILMNAKKLSEILPKVEENKNKRKLLALDRWNSNQKNQKINGPWAKIKIYPVLKNPP